MPPHLRKTPQDFGTAGIDSSSKSPVSLSCVRGSTLEPPPRTLPESPECLLSLISSIQGSPVSTWTFGPCHSLGCSRPGL